MFNNEHKKYKKIPNSEYLNVWLQRNSKNRLLKVLGDNTRLCKYVKIIRKNPTKNSINTIWNYSACGNEIHEIFKNTPIVDVDKFESMTEDPMPDEIKVFQNYQ